jgi:hypothetical protein
MTHFRTRLLAIAFLALVGLAATPHARAAVITSPNTQFQVGLGTLGNLFDPTPIITNDPGPPSGSSPVHSGTGFLRVVDGYDPIEPFIQREYWGVSIGSVHGYVDPALSVPPDMNIVLNTSNIGASTASISTFLKDVAGLGPNVLQIDQNFSFVPTGQNILQIDVTLSNLTGSSQTAVYRRGVDWDIVPFFTGLPFEIVTVQSPAAPVTQVTADGIGSNPDPFFPYTGPLAGPGVYGPGDLGGGITVAFSLAPSGQPGDTFSFKFFHAISDVGQSESGLRGQLAGLDVNYVISGRTSQDQNAAAIGVQVVPEPATFALLGAGLAGFAVCRWRRRRSG